MRQSPSAQRAVLAIWHSARTSAVRPVSRTRQSAYWMQVSHRNSERDKRRSSQRGKKADLQGDLGWRRLGKNGETVATVHFDLHRSCISGRRVPGSAPENLKLPVDQDVRRNAAGLCKIRGRCDACTTPALAYTVAFSQLGPWLGLASASDVGSIPFRASGGPCRKGPGSAHRH